MNDREAAAKMAAIANLPIGWLFEDPRRDREVQIAAKAEPTPEGAQEPAAG